MTFVVLACASAPTFGPLGEGTVANPRITNVDTAFPPRHVWVELQQPGYVALLLVAPGHSATLLYPRDSATNNELRAGTHQITFAVPDLMVESDSIQRARARDSVRAGAPGRARGTRTRTVQPIPPATPTYLLLVTSPQQLHYGRIVEKTLGVSIPNIDEEALNAVGKAIKSTIANEPRDWGGFYRLIELRRAR
jgi:hypothetical protein